MGSQASGTYSHKRLTATQRQQLKDVPLIGQNPGNVRDYKKGNTNGIRVDTELLGGLPAARNKFKELTGQNLPIKVEGRIEVPLPKGGRVVFRELGDSGHPKLEITSNTTKGIVLEKITFRSTQ